MVIWFIEYLVPTSFLIKNLAMCMYIGVSVFPLSKPSIILLCTSCACNLFQMKILC